MDKYLKIFEPAMKKWLAEHYSPEEAKKRWERTVALDEKWIQEEGDLGGRKNAMASNMLEAYAFFAFYDSVDRSFTPEDLQSMIGTALYMIAALNFVRYLNEKLDQCSDKWGRRFLKLFIVGLYWGCMVFVYFHLACGTLIHTYNVIFEAVGGDTERAVTAWNRAYLVQAVPYWASFVVLELATTVGWFAIIWKGVLPLKKRWVLAAPMLVAGIGFLLELILPLPFNGFASGFESLGWIVMFLGGIQAIKNDDREAD